MGKRKRKEKKSNFVDTNKVGTDYDIYKKGALVGGVVGGIGGLIIGKKIILSIVVGAVIGGYINYQLNKEEVQSFNLKKIIKNN